MGIHRRGWWSCMKRAGLIASLQDTRTDSPRCQNWRLSYKTPAGKWTRQIAWATKGFFQLLYRRCLWTGSLTNRNVFSSVLEAESPSSTPSRSDVWRGSCLMIFFLVGGKWDGCCVLALQNDERVGGEIQHVNLEGMQTSGHANPTCPSHHLTVDQNTKAVSVSISLPPPPPPQGPPVQLSSSWLLTGFWFFPGS